MNEAQDTEVDSNFEAFKAMLPRLIKGSAGRYALLHNRDLVELFDDSVTAFMAGLEKFGQGAYSVQEVSDQPDNLGFYSYAGGSGQA
jgi:hypothetical protein